MRKTLSSITRRERQKAHRRGIEQGMRPVARTLLKASSKPQT